MDFSVILLLLPQVLPLVFPMLTMQCTDSRFDACKNIAGDARATYADGF